MTSGWVKIRREDEVTEDDPPVDECQSSSTSRAEENGGYGRT